MAKVGGVDWTKVTDKELEGLIKGGFPRTFSEEGERAAREEWARRQQLKKGKVSPGDHSCNISEVVGPYAWGVIHHAAESFPCAPCAEEGASLMRFAHDLVNIRLGKPVQHVKDARRWLGPTHELEEILLKNDDSSLEETVARALLSQKTNSLVYAPNPDPWDSRCRNIAGRWVHTDNCPHTRSTELQPQPTLFQDDEPDDVEIGEDDNPEDDPLEREIAALVQSTLMEAA